MTATDPGVEILDPLTESSWDRLVKSRPEASFFHTSAWAKVLNSAYGYKPFYFAKREGVRLLAAICVMEVNSVLTGRRGVSLPFTDFCEPLAEDDLSRSELLEQVLEFGRSRKWKYLEWRGGTRILEGGSPSLEMHTHTLALAANETKVFNGFKGVVRTAIRKAQDAGVTVDFSHSIEALRSFYELHCKTRGKHGLPPQPFSFFQQIFDHVLSRGLGFVATARSEKKPVASAVFFSFRDKAIYKYGASDEQFQHLRGNNLLFWEVIKAFCRNGVTQLHMGRSSIGAEGLRRFKLGWGCAEETVNYWKYDLRKESYVVEKDQSIGWHNSVFSMMPSLFSRCCGQLLYRHIG
jgi:lipid II:glycine glycyltransferase (peptidoglycan interpeptide bridge formation enzyme)